MEWIADPSAWLGLLTLVVLEIVLGIDNLIFIAILADKLPPHQRDRARQLGLGLALGMRLLLLAGMSWLVTLTDPLFSLWGKALSGRDLILLAGGLFLLFKATMELHERLEGKDHNPQGPGVHARFWAVVVQIIILDAVFSLDAVITAVGMVEDLAVMMIAVVIAIGMMIIASKPLTAFVNKHPTVVMLCLGFLLMIGFSLVAEGAGFHIPKGYLYAAIAFSVLIEVFNQLALFNRKRYLAGARPLRERTAEAVLKLLGGRPDTAEVGSDVAAMAETGGDEPVFDPSERTMIRGVLLLAERPVQSLMTPRPDIVWVDLAISPEDLLATLRQHPHSRLVVSRGELDKMVGVARSRDLLTALLADQPLNLKPLVTEPLVIPEGTTALHVLKMLRQTPAPLAIVVDEYGSIEGLVTPHDLLTAIVGELADTDAPDTPAVSRREDGTWLLDGSLSVEQVEELLEIRIPRNEGNFHTLAGLALAQLQQVPTPGEWFELEAYRFTIHAMEAQRILQVEVDRASPPESAAASSPPEPENRG